MPSSHAQFVAFFAVSLSLFLLLRHVPSASTSYSPSTFMERALLSILACCCASVVAASRIYLNYHTSKQVLVGVGVGASTAIAWFAVTTILRHYGWIDWALENPLARTLRMRDLVTTEDLVDAGWGRFELRRQASRAASNIDRKKAR
jgi:dolichyldiphosphatase